MIIDKGYTREALTKVVECRVENIPVHVIRDHTLKYHPKWSILKAEIIPENQ